MKTIISLSRGPELPVEILEYQHCTEVSLAPGFVVLLNQKKESIAMFNSHLVISIVQPDNDTNLVLRH